MLHSKIYCSINYVQIWITDNPVIVWTQPELIPSIRQKTGPFFIIYILLLLCFPH